MKRVMGTPATLPNGCSSRGLPGQRPPSPRDLLGTFTARRGTVGDPFMPYGSDWQHAKCTQYSLMKPLTDLNGEFKPMLALGVCLFIRKSPYRFRLPAVDARDTGATCAARRYHRCNIAEQSSCRLSLNELP